MNINDMVLTKGFYVDTANRRWEIFYFDKVRNEFRGVLRHTGIIADKKRYTTFAINGCGTASKYKLTNRV